MGIETAVVPAAPALVPELTSGHAPGLGEVRAATADAVTSLLATDPGVVVVLTGGRTAPADETAVGTLRSYGVDVHAGPSPGAATDVAVATLDPPAALGAWLLDQAGWNGSRRYVSAIAASDDMPAGDLLSAGVLALADGSAAAAMGAGAAELARAEQWDAAVSDALRRGNVDALAALDNDEADRVQARGAAVLRHLAALTDPPDAATMTFDGAPWGVRYWVARWTGTRDAR